MRNIWFISACLIVFITLAACSDSLGPDEVDPPGELATQACGGYPLLKLNDRGAYVRYAQEQLMGQDDDVAKHIGNSGGVDGIFGDGTRKAVRVFQKKKGLKVDGKIGDDTWAKLGCNAKVRFPSGLRLPVADRVRSGYDDPTGSGNPLLDVKSSLNKKIAKNFTVREFAHSGNTTFEYARIDPKLVQCVQKIRNKLGPVVINSGYRSRSHNDKVGGASKSQHMGGRAADIKSSGESGLDIAKTAIRECGCNIGVGVANSYAHIDVRGRYASWDYDKNSNVLENAIDRYRSQRCN